MSLFKKISSIKGFIDQSFIDENVDVRDFISTGVYIIDLMLSGKILDGGIPKGRISQISAPSALGKSFIGLSTLKNAQKKGMFCVIIDTERAFDFVWAKSIGIDTSEDRLMVLQSNRIEKVQEKIVTLANSISTEDQQEVFVLLDSWGGLVTSKTVDDAGEGKDVLDMTEAKKKNKLSKLLMGTHFTGFVVNHVYDNIGGFGDPLKIPGGRGLYFASSCILMSTSKSKDGKGEDMNGVIVRCKTQKSRKSKEFMEGEYRIKRNGGLDRFYGLLDDAMDQGHVIKPSNGWYTRPFIKDDKKYRESEIYNQDFWLPIFKDTDFIDKMEAKYAYVGSVLDISNEIDWDAIDEEEEKARGN